MKVRGSLFYCLSLAVALSTSIAFADTNSRTSQPTVLLVNSEEGEPALTTAKVTPEIVNVKTPHGRLTKFRLVTPIETSAASVPSEGRPNLKNERVLFFKAELAESFPLEDGTSVALPKGTGVVLRVRLTPGGRFMRAGTVDIEVIEVKLPEQGLTLRFSVTEYKAQTPAPDQITYFGTSKGERTVFAAKLLPTENPQNPLERLIIVVAEGMGELPVVGKATGGAIKLGLYIGKMVASKPNLSFNPGTEFTLVVDDVQLTKKEPTQTTKPN